MTVQDLREQLRAELAEHVEALDRFGAEYADRYLRATLEGRQQSCPRPVGRLHSAHGLLVRELVLDAVSATRGGVTL